MEKHVRRVGTVSRGIRCPIIREGDNLAAIVTESVLEAAKEEGFSLRDRDVISITESIVARAQGNYATVQNIADDVRAKLGGGTVGVIFPILSRNRFAICLRGIAMGCKKVVLMLSYPSDEVGNELVSIDKIDEEGINPYSDVLSLAEYRKHFGIIRHQFTGVDYVEYYENLVKECGADVEIVFANHAKDILKYTDCVINCDIHTRARTKRILKEAGAKVVCGLDDIVNAPVNGSGYNEKYGLLGSNKATEDTIKLFPRNCQPLVLDIQKRIKEVTGKEVEVMVYGDGAFKDPKGKIWELADPVVSPAYTNGLIGVPNEVKLKYLADNDFKNLSETVQTKLIENLWQKGDLELKESWISELKNRGEETAPLQKVDIEWAKNYLKDWTIEKSDLDELTFSQSEINRILKSNIKKSIQNVIGDFEEGKDEKNQVNISATFDTNRLNPGKVYNGENVYFSIPLKYCKEEKIIDKVCEEYEKLFGYKPKYWSGGQRTSPDPEDYMRFYTGATANLGFDDDFKEHLFEVNPIIEKQKEELTFVNSQLDEIFNIKKIASNQFEYSYKVEGKLSDSDTIEFKQDLPILEAANIIAFRELSGLNLSNFEISENERSNELYMVCVNMEGREERNYIYTGEQLKERDAASYEAASKNPSDWNYGKSYASNITSSVKKVENLDELKEFLNGNYSTSAHEEEVATDIEFYINDEGKPCREWNYSFDFGDYMADKYNYDNSQSFEDYLNDVKKVIDSYNDKELSDLYSKRREIAESYDDYSRTKEIFEEIQKEKLHSLDYKNEEDVLRFQNWFNQIVSENLQIKSYENAKLLLSYATDFNDGDYKYAINENNEIYFNTEADSAGWEKTTLDNFVSSAINNSYSLIEDGYASPEEKDFIQDFDEEWTSQQQLINNSLGKIVDSTKEFYEFFKDVGSPDYLKSRFEDARRENEENGIDNDDDTVLPIAIENMIDSEIPIKDLNLIQDITHDILNGKYKDFEDVRENYKENYKEFYPELRENDLDSLYTPLSKEALMKFINIEEIDSFTEEMAEHCLGIFENQNIPLVTDELGNVYQREISKDLATGTDEDLTLLSPSGVIDFYRNEIERDFEQSAEIESEKPQVLKILENLEDKLVKIEENQKQIDKLQFDWSDFTKQDFDDLKERLQNPEEMFDDIFGSVKIGDISIDIVNNYGNDVENGYLDDDFYIFGEEGYDVNSATGLPYNEVDGKGISFATILNSDYETFQKIMEKEWSETISKSEYLLTEAQRPLLKEWGSEEAFELYEQKRREEGIEDTISISQKNALSDISVDSMDEILVLDDENVNFDVYLTDEFWRRTGYFKSETEMKSVLNDENNNLYQTVTINPDTKDVYLNIDGYKNRVQKLKLKGDGVDYLINALEQRCLSTDNKSIKMIRDELFSEINYKVAKNVLLAVADHGYPDAFVAQRELGLTDSQMKDLLENTSKTHKEIWDKQEIDILETIGEKLVNRYLEDNGFDNEASNPNYFKDYEPCKNTLSDLILTFEDKPMTNQEKIWDRFIQNILNERINDPKISFKQAYTNVLTKVISTGLDSDYKELSEIFKKIYNGNPNSIFEKIDKDVSQKLKNKKLDMTFLKENSVIETKSDSKTRIASISQKLHSSNQNREL